MVQAGEKQVKATQRAVHREGSHIYLGQGRFGLKPTGWNVCRDMVKNLDLLQQSDASYRCELKFHPSMTQFSEPEWEELKIEDYWQEVYAIEHELLSRKRVPRSVLPFDQWQQQYLEDMRAGHYLGKRIDGLELRYLFWPRLRMSKVRFEQNGPLVTVLAYSLFADYDNICKESKKKCSPILDDEKKRACWKAMEEQYGGEIYDDEGDYIVIYNPYKKEIEKIYPGDYDKDFTTSRNPYKIFLYKERAFLVKGYIGEFGIFNIRSDMKLNHPFYFNNSCFIERVKHVPTKK